MTMEEQRSMLSKLINKRFNRISRAIDMLALFLGEDFTFTSESGRTAEVAEYSLHVQSQWRFRENDRILLASRDIYEPYAKTVPEDWEYDSPGRPEELSSVFDVCAKSLMKKMQGTWVTKCALSPVNDVSIEFSNGVVFEQFMPASGKAEEWRLLDYTQHSHTLCYDENGSISCT